MAENWLALGLAEEALHELTMIPHAARCHPEVLRVQKQIASLSPLEVDMWLSPRRYKRHRRRPSSPPESPPDYSFPQY